MQKRKNKVYSNGDIINVYLNKSVPQDFCDWINNQSDLTAFFLYAAQQLYKETGDIDVISLVPRQYSLKQDIREQVIEKPIYKYVDTLPPSIKENDSNQNESINNNDNKTIDSSTVLKNVINENSDPIKITVNESNVNNDLEDNIEKTVSPYVEDEETESENAWKGTENMNKLW